MVGLLGGRVRDVEGDRHVELDRHQLLREAGVVGLSLQRLAGALGLHLIGPCQHGLQVSELLEKLHRTLVADALHSRHVVRAVAHQRQVVHHLPWRHAEPLGGIGLIDPLLVHAGGAAAAGIQQGDAGIDELVEILVARHDHRQPTGGRLPRGQRADHVVRFVAVHRDDRHAEGPEHGLDLFHGGVKVGLQLVVELFAGALVLGVALGAERVPGVLHPDQMIGLVLGAQAQEEVDHTPRRRGVLAATGPEGTRDEGEERAVDQRVAVDKEGLWGGVGHGGRVAGNREQGTGNGERGTGNGQRATGNGRPSDIGVIPKPAERGRDLITRAATTGSLTSGCRQDPSSAPAAPRSG